VESRLRIFSTKKLREPLSQAIQSREDLLFAEADFIRMIPLPPAPDAILRIITETSAIVFTSAYAVHQLASGFPGNASLPLRIFCLEGATRAAVIGAFGERSIIGTAAQASALAELIIARQSYPSVAFFCGDQRRDELPLVLREQGITVEELVIYATEPSPAELPFTPDAVMFFSPSAVDSFFSRNDPGPGVVCIAIGPTTAAALRDHSPDLTIISAARPAQEAMLEAISLHFQRNILERANQ